MLPTAGRIMDPADGEASEGGVELARGGWDVEVDERQ